MIFISFVKLAYILHTRK